MSTGRYLDAHEGSNDNSVVTRPPQSNSTQQWLVKKAVAPAPAPSGTIVGEFTIQQKSTGRYLDAHEGSNDNSAVTRPPQLNRTQVWVLRALGNNLYTIQQKSSGLYLDAHQGPDSYDIVTRQKQNNMTQKWVMTSLGNKTYTIKQRSTGRYIDAHDGSNDNSAVTRKAQNNNTQRWIITSSE